MIWRLPDPIKGIVAGVLTFAVLAALMGFGVGIPELLLLGLVSSVVCWLVATGNGAESRPS